MSPGITARDDSGGGAGGGDAGAGRVRHPAATTRIRASSSCRAGLGAHTRATTCGTKHPSRPAAGGDRCGRYTTSTDMTWSSWPCAIRPSWFCSGPGPDGFCGGCRQPGRRVISSWRHPPGQCSCRNPLPGIRSPWLRCLSDVRLRDPTGAGLVAASIARVRRSAKASARTRDSSPPHYVTDALLKLACRRVFPDS